MRFHLALALAGVLAASPLWAQVNPQPPRPAPPSTTGYYPPALYQMPDVGKTLNLTAEQVASLNKLTEQTQTQFRDPYAKLAALAEAERLAQIQDLNRQYVSDWNKAARDIFNDTQRARYQQLYYQYGGFNAFTDPEIQKRLALTDAQLRDLRDQQMWSARQMQDVNRLGTTDATKAAQMYRDYWRERQERFNKYLTAEQQKLWREMVGDPYTFQPTFVPPR
jgi:hypothetical protein